VRARLSVGCDGVEAVDDGERVEALAEKVGGSVIRNGVARV